MLFLMGVELIVPPYSINWCVGRFILVTESPIHALQSFCCDVTQSLTLRAYCRETTRHLAQQKGGKCCRSRRRPRPQDRLRSSNRSRHSLCRPLEQIRTSSWPRRGRSRERSRKYPSRCWTLPTCKMTFTSTSWIGRHRMYSVSDSARASISGVPAHPRLVCGVGPPPSLPCLLCAALCVGAIRSGANCGGARWFRQSM